MKKLLLVEGYSDKNFFEALIRKVSLDVKVEVVTPTEIGSEKDGKDNAINCVFVELKGTEYSHLSLVVDADYPKGGLGYEKTREKIAKGIIDLGYDTKPEEIGFGFKFNHSAEGNPFGLWVMSNNFKDGMFENWVKDAINSAEKPLFDLAVSTVNSLPNPQKFNPKHTSKAEFGTWMAWQKKPVVGFGKDNKIEELLDFDSEPMKQLIAWLKAIYA